MNLLEKEIWNIFDVLHIKIAFDVLWIFPYHPFLKGDKCFLKKSCIELQFFTDNDMLQYFELLKVLWFEEVKEIEFIES